MSRLAGKRAVVTGAASGIGRAAAVRFTAEGATVTAFDIDRAGLQRLADETGLATVAVDLTDEVAVQAAFADLGALDVIVANAGVQLFGQDAAVHELDAAVWDSTIRVNLRGTFLTCKYGIRALLAAGGGSLIVTGSPTGLFGCAPGFSAYSASKAGATGLARVIAADYAAQNIRANVVVPGFTATPLVAAIVEDEQARTNLLATVPLGRPGTPEDAAAVMVFLASDEAAYVTGAIYPVDGGMTAI